MCFTQQDKRKAIPLYLLQQRGQDPSLNLYSEEIWISRPQSKQKELLFPHIPQLGQFWHISMGKQKLGQIFKREKKHQTLGSMVWESVLRAT